LAELRSTLRERMQNSVLMDAPRFTRQVEQAYREMWRDWCAGKTKDEGCSMKDEGPFSLDSSFFLAQ